MTAVTSKQKVAKVVAIISGGIGFCIIIALVLYYSRKVGNGSEYSRVMGSEEVWDQNEKLEDAQL